MKKLIFLLPFFPLWGCSLKTIALRSTAALLDQGKGALYEEADPAFAKDAMPSQLKLLEELLRNEPGNKNLLLLCAEGFSGYSFLFLEDSQPERAKIFYQRGREHALRALARSANFERLGELDNESLSKLLLTARKSDVPGLFWAAFNWAGYINLSKDNPQAISELPKAVAIMKRVEELDPDFNFAGPELFFGVYYASRPALLGGNINKAKAYFEQARTRTKGLFLMAYVLEARYYAVGAQDRELFTGLLTKVKDAPSGELPDSKLADEVAKLKAAALLEKTDDYF